MFAFLRRMGCRLRAAWHGLAGRLWFRARVLPRARCHFERVLSLRGDDFAAYVYLGRLAFALGDYAGWRREFEHARRTDPERFAKLRQPFDLFEPRAAGTPFDEAGERATWRSMRPMPPGSARRSPVRSVELPTALPGDHAAPAEGPADALSGSAAEDPRPDELLESGAGGAGGEASDDCISANERQRFRRRGPISRSEIEAADLDDTLRRLIAG